MRSLRQYLNKYQESHQNPLNAAIHIVCIPAIVFSTLGLLWIIPVGRWLGVSEPLAGWINPATLAALPLGLFYLRLSLVSLVAMSIWFALCIWGIVAVQSAGLPLIGICAVVWTVAWTVQLYGHWVEGAKPSFFDDLQFLLIGPLFVVNKFYRRLGWQYA